ncbi:MAG: sigma 54-interacting transcriptional regulator, partial [Acidobacteriota bacterium]
MVSRPWRRITSTPSRTIDVSQTRIWEGSGDATGTRGAPRLRILYHRDLDRIGAVSEPDLPLTAADWQIVGRKAPLFSRAGRQVPLRPLADPAVSRQQLRLRWRIGAQGFEIEPLGKRTVTAFAPDGTARQLSGKAVLPPNSSLAIGNRVLLALEHTPYRLPEADRLGLVGECATMWELRDLLQEIAAFDGGALVLGQTGTGKELVARALHAASPRRDGPFVTVNCAALPEQLVESLFFGHVKGAFTGAERSQVGYFQAADGGTLFLDELGEMPPAIQPKLLRTLEDGRVATLGTLAEARVDVRLIAATNRHPEAEIAAGRLREDLYYRVARHVLRLPPLADRRLDIPELLVTFLDRLRGQHPELDWLWHGAASWQSRIPLDFFLGLLTADFTGNVRQLRNLAEQTALRNRTPGPFRAPELPKPVTPEPEPSSSDTASPLGSRTVAELDPEHLAATSE